MMVMFVLELRALGRFFIAMSNLLIAMSNLLIIAMSKLLIAMSKLLIAMSNLLTRLKLLEQIAYVGSRAKASGWRDLNSIRPPSLFAREAHFNGRLNIRY